MTTTPPIGPSTPVSRAPTGGGLSPVDQARSDLEQIKEIDLEIQKALAEGKDPTDLIKKLQKPMQDLQNIAKTQPPVLSKGELQTIDDAESQYQDLSQAVERWAPSLIAKFQGTCDTINQLLSAPPGAKINVKALEDQNQLTELASALQLQIQAHNGSSRNQACEDLIQQMQAPLMDLETVAGKGQLTSDQSQLVDDLSGVYRDFQKHETTDKSSVSQFQNYLDGLNNALLETP
jgi:hypothetical protein